MGNEFAVDDLYTTGWLPLDTSGCARDSQGRWYPTKSRIDRECEELGATISVDEAQKFGCVTASWNVSDQSGRCIAGSTDEALIHALGQARRAASQVQLIA